MYTFTKKLSHELTVHDREAIWTILEQNMRGCYERSSLGWRPSFKKRQLFNALSRFIVVHSTDGEVVAFSMFRLETGNVLYCYELQVSTPVQRQRLGTLLMQQITDVGTQRRLDKIMLTVFTANVNALRFYNTFGFTNDESEPDEAADYLILSKRI